MSPRIWRLLAVALIVLAGSMFPAAGLAQTVIKYVHTDALGSVVLMTDQNRNVIERREYEPYGEQLTPTVQGGPGYTGHVQDAATGLTYMQQRYYDPAIGIFLSVDPVTAYSDPIGQFHRYRYANNNPYKFTDPDGREVVVAPGAHQSAINNELRILRSTPSGEAIYRKLHESSNTHTIQAAGLGERNSATADSWEGFSDANGVPRGGSGSTIKLELDPERIAKPVFVAMAHEMGHAGAMDDGIQSQDASRVDGGGNTPPSEVPAMEVENNVRREHGMPARGPYHPPEDSDR